MWRWGVVVERIINTKSYLFTVNGSWNLGKSTTGSFQKVPLSGKMVTRRDEMDQEKIGKFIADCRKEKGLTQLQLAEKLGISNRAVSKWETGKGCPDVSLMLELCNVLEITVNELLSGERILMEDYQKKAEENLVELQDKKMKAQKMLKKVELVWMAIAILLAPVHLAINYFYPDNVNTGIGAIVILIGAIMFIVYFLRYYKIEIKLK